MGDITLPKILVILGASLAFSLLTMLQITAAQAANPTIEAILGGGTVLGTECVNGKVVESLYQSSATFTEFGPEATLYVKSTEKVSDGVKTRLRRTASPGWTSDKDYQYTDKVVFNLIAGGALSNKQHYLVSGTQVNLDAEFGSSDGGFAKVENGQGEWMMSFQPHYYSAGARTDLGVMYTATLNGDLSWSCTGPDPTPEDQTPDAPTITSLVPGNESLSATYSAAPETTYGIASYQYKLDVKDGAAGTWTAITGALPTDEQTATLSLTGLTNGTTYVLTIRAIDSEGGEGDPSNSVSDTPRIVCANTNFPAVGSTEADSFQCTHNDVTYEFADFHILTTDGSDVCSAPDSYLPTGDNNGQGLFCAPEGSTVRAIYDWDNGQSEFYARHQLTWLASIQQIGSRSDESGGDACGALGTTVNGRCANQLKVGEDAFRGMAGDGGDAIENLDTSNLNNIEHIFHDASQFNQNVSTKQVTVNNVTYIAWDISGVDRINSAFWRATNFNNGGQPLYWDTGSVWNMGYMFAQSSFNQDIGTREVTIGNKAFTAWDTSSVQFFDNMFNGATAFDQDVSGWVTTAGTNMSSMFYGASSFNQDLSSWNVTAVTNNSNFDEGASAWCGTGFDNRGRPSDWTPSLADGCPAGVDTFVSLEAPPSAVAGDELTYSLAYWNSSNAATNGNTLVLTLPTDVTLPADAELSGGTASGGTVTWNNLPVPGGTTPDSGATILVTSIVGSSVASGTNLEAQVEITDDGGNTINDTAIVTVTSQAILQVTLSADPYVLPGEEITYQVTVENVGKSDTTGTMTLIWDAESGVVPATSTDARCNGTPLACSWSESLRAGERQSRSITVKMEADIPLKASVLATASASAPNAAESDESAASATTEVAGAPDLNLTLTSLPREMVKPGGTIVYSLVLSNEGNELAKDLFVALPIPAGTVASIPDGAFCDSQASTTTCEASYLSWNLPNLDSDQKADALTVSVTAPSSQAGLTLQGQYAGKNNVTDETVQGVSNNLSLQIGERPDVELTASFGAAEFQPNGQLSLRFNYENVGTAASEPGELRFNVPTHTVLKSWPQGASCDAAACSDGFSGKVTLPVPSLSENSGARSTDSAEFALQTLPEATSVKVNAAVLPDAVGDFLPTAASTDTALLRRDPALPVPTLPLAALLTLLGLLGGLGYRRLLAA